jgi:MtfA peptidase
MEDLSEMSNAKDFMSVLFLFGIFIVWGVFAVVGFSFFKITTGLANLFFNQYILAVHSLSSREKGTLEYNNPFYKNLNPSNKRKFGCNVKYFLSQKQFEGRDGFVITDDMKLQIAGVATQIAFGHFPTTYEHFRRILVYPDKYFSGTTQRYHVGEVQSNGIIKLSWKAFKEGAEVRNDGVHVGYHEMAHALKIEDATLHDMEHCFMDKYALREFHKYASVRISEYRGESFMRDYAFTNSEEFFAVSIEYFFEMPNQLRKNEPEVYGYLTQILKLDPINHLNPVLS